MTQPPAGNAEAAACHQRGLELLQGNQASGSLAELERAVTLEPANAVFLKSLGNARKATGDLTGAMASYRRSLEIAPDYTIPRYNLGLVLLELGQPQQAEQEFRRIHEVDPRDAEVLFQLALLAADRLEFAAAAQLYRSALEITPDNPYLWFHLGMAYRQMPGYVGQSIESMLKSLELKPDLADAHQQVGNILEEERRVDEAAAHYREAIRHSPDNARAHANLGDALSSLGNVAEAISAYSKAIELDPGLIFAHYNLASVCGIAGKHEQALRCYEEILRLRPDDTNARGLLLFEMQRGCNWSRFDELCRLQLQSIVSQPDSEIHPFSVLCIPSTPGEQLQCARNHAAIRSRAVAHFRDHLRFQFQRRAGPRLRIGYLSGELHEHPVPRLIAELIELHDRSRFEVAAYSYGPNDGSPMRARLKQSFDHFVNIRPMSNANAAAQINDDGVDILVDLTGYTAYNRTEIAALRPAPVQVNYLGYPGTMGADFIDYIVTDRFITPPGHEAHYSEQPVYLPGSYQANDRKRSVADTPPRSELGLSEKAFVFCCFNQVTKILPDVFAAWMRLLKAVPHGALWLLKSNTSAEQNLRREAQHHGIAPERLVFAPVLPQAQHLGRFRAADLFLDTSPYNAHTTASDALWAGLPVLTCSGDTFASRVAGSLLTAVGLPELITYSPQAYEALALRLARNPGELAGLRDKLLRNRSTAPLFDTPTFTRHLEAAYLRMWENYLAGQPPRAIHL